MTDRLTQVDFVFFFPLGEMVVPEKWDSLFFPISPPTFTSCNLFFSTASPVFLGCSLPSPPLLFHPLSPLALVLLLFYCLLFTFLFFSASFSHVPPHPLPSFSPLPSISFGFTSLWLWLLHVFTSSIPSISSPTHSLLLFLLTSLLLIHLIQLLSLLFQPPSSTSSTLCLSWRIPVSGHLQPFDWSYKEL